MLNFHENKFVNIELCRETANFSAVFESILMIEGRLFCKFSKYHSSLMH